MKSSLGGNGGVFAMWPRGAAERGIAHEHEEEKDDPMTHGFDKEFWERHWEQGRAEAPAAGSMGHSPGNPYLEREIGGLTPGTALDAGCGAGAEAIWLAEHGWQVTGADISSEALSRAALRAATSGASERLRWVEADLGVWVPSAPFDLVTTHYAHPAMPQLDFYDRIAEWVAPGGTLLIVGHLHTPSTPEPGSERGNGHGHGHEETHGHGPQQGHGHQHGHEQGHPPAEASATSAAVTARLNDTRWEIVTAEEQVRTLPGHGGDVVTLHDVVVRAVRRR